MHLKPGVEKTTDLGFFTDTVRMANKVFLFTTSAGHVKGMYTIYELVEKCNITGKRRLVVEPEFGFILEEYQGKYMSKTIFRNSVRTFLKYPFISKYLLGPAYPASYLTLEKYGKKAWTWLDEDTPADVKDVLYTYAVRHEMLEDGQFSGIKSLYTVPKKTSTTDMARLEKKNSYHHYKKLNPQWTEGYGLVTIIKFSLRNLLGSL